MMQLIIMGILISVLLLVSSYLLLGWIGFVISLIFIGIGWVYFQRVAFVLINEVEYGVVFNKTNERFVRFLDSSTNKHFNYHHFVDPFREKLTGKIPKGTQTSKGITPPLRTKDGIPVEINWAVSFKINIYTMKPGIEHKMARSLPIAAVNMITGRVLHSLRHIIEQKSIDELYGPGAIQSLETEVRHDVYKRSIAIGVQKIPHNDIKLGPIIIPDEVERAIRANHERKLQIETLKSLQEAVSQLDETDLAKLKALESLRILENNGSSRIVLMEQLLKET